MKIPEGAAPPSQIAMIPKGAPPPVQLPTIKNMNESNQCLILSCTSALHYLGHTDEASAIVRQINKSRERRHNKFEFDCLKLLITDNLGKTKIRRWKYDPFD